MTSTGIWFFLFDLKELTLHPNHITNSIKFAYKFLIDCVCKVGEGEKVGGARANSAAGHDSRQGSKVPHIPTPARGFPADARAQKTNCHFWSKQVLLSVPC